MNLFTSAVEGVTRGLMGYFFDPKEEAPKLPPYSVKGIGIDGIATELTHTYRDSKAVKVKSCNDGAVVALTSEELKRVTILIHELPKSHRIYESVSPTIDSLHPMVRSQLWAFGQKIKSGSQIEKPFKEFMSTLDAITATGVARLYSFDTDRTKYAISASAVFITGDTRNPVFYIVEFCCDSTRYRWTDPSNSLPYSGVYYATVYDDHMNLTKVAAFDEERIDRCLVEIEVNYVPGVTFPYTPVPYLPTDVELPENVQQLLDLVTVTAVHQRAQINTGKLIIMYDCIDKLDRSLVVSVTY